jgi:hypothetical protein
MIGLHIIKNPNNRFMFVGNVPFELGYKKNDGSTLTEDDKKALSIFPSVAMKTRGISNVSFESANEAEEKALELGYEVNK